jgi:hypothetical protein
MVMKIRIFALLVCLALVGVTAPPSAAHAAGTTQTGTYYPVATSRILDTRDGTGGVPVGPLGAARSLDLVVAGKGHVPLSGVSAVVLNLTVTRSTGSSFLTAYPTGQARPTTSAINYRTGITRANIATLPLGTGGRITIYNNSGSVHVLADVLGFYASDDNNLQTLGEGEEFQLSTPQRLIDTRTDPEGPLAGAAGANKLILDVAFGTDGAMSKYVSAVMVNVTALGATTGGYLTTWDGVGDPPATSTLSFPDKAAIANLAVIRTSLCTVCEGSPPPVEFAIANKSQNAVHVLVDLVGVYYNNNTEGLRFAPQAPVRISDSRKPLNGTTFNGADTQTLTAPTSVAGSNTVALVSNMTIVSPSTSTFLTTWSADQTTRPGVSNVNTPAGVTAANGAVVPLSTTRRFNLYNNAGTTNFLVDVAGRFNASSSVAAQKAVAATTQSDLRATVSSAGRRPASANR